MRVHVYANVKFMGTVRERTGTERKGGKRFKKQKRGKETKGARSEVKRSGKVWGKQRLVVQYTSRGRKKEPIFCCMHLFQYLTENGDFFHIH